MCNLYSQTKGQQAIIAAARAMVDRTGNLPPLPGIFPDYGAPIVRDGPVGRELVLARWGMPSPLFALKGKRTDAGVTNIRNAGSLHWRRWLGPENRCLVPFTSFSENELSPGGSKEPIWFAFDQDRPLAFFAGLWTRWRSIRKVREGEVTATLFGFLTTEPNGEVAVVHPQAMPAILTTPEEYEIWLRAPWSEASTLQRPLPDDSLTVVLRGEKQDGRIEDLVDLAAAASMPHAEPPLPLLDGTPDRPDDAATVALMENVGRKSG
jgi:putative SOS response-associated peptidase YedK